MTAEPQDQVHLDVEPPRHQAGEDLVTPSVVGHGSEWGVEIVITRGPDADRVAATDLRVGLWDRQGGALEVEEQPDGLLPQAGGGLGVSVNASYRFVGAEPARLIVEYAGQRLVFSPSPSWQPGR